MTRLFTTDQAAKRLNIKPLTLRKYLRLGLIPGEKIQGKWHISEANLDQFLRARIQIEASRRVSARGFLNQFSGHLSSEVFLAGKHAEEEA